MRRRRPRLSTSPDEARAHTKRDAARDGVWAPPSALEIVLDVVVGALAVVLLARLALFVAPARLTSDECFHAWMSQWISAHGTLPREVPGLYSGFRYFYPPLLHLLGAAFVSIGGVEAFRFVNVACLAGSLAVVAIGVGRVSSRASARLAVLLLLAFGGFVLQGVRLFAEALSAWLAVAAVVTWIGLWRNPRGSLAIACGLAVGLGLLAKQTGLVALAVTGVLAAVSLGRRDGARARAFGVATLVAAGLALPYWVRNAVLFGSPVYPLFGRDLHQGLLRLNVMGYTPGPAKFFSSVLRDAGPWVWGALSVALAVAAWRRRTIAHALIGGAAFLLGAAPLVPMLDARHAVPLVAALVVLSAIVVAEELARRPGWLVALPVALSLAVGARVATMPDLRQPLDPPREYEDVWAAVRRHVPPEATVLCLETYDAFYYTGRAATWPIPWGQKDPPVEFFDERQPAVILAQLRRHDIDFMLLPDRARGATFNTANYPLGFMLGVRELVRAGSIEVVQALPHMLILRVKPAAEGG